VSLSEYFTISLSSLRPGFDVLMVNSNSYFPKCSSQFSLRISHVHNYSRTNTHTHTHTRTHSFLHDLLPPPIPPSWLPKIVKMTFQFPQKVQNSSLCPLRPSVLDTLHPKDPMQLFIYVIHSWKDCRFTVEYEL
jgi:hypothetical protein